MPLFVADEHLVATDLQAFGIDIVLGLIAAAVSIEHSGNRHA